jgi:spore germination protein GerM
VLALPACTRVHGAVAIPRAEIPFSVTRAAPQESPPGPVSSHLLSFVRNGRLISVTRSVSTAQLAESVLATLLDGPTEIESRHGITTEIPFQTRLLQVLLSRRVAHVNLSSEFQAPGSRESVLLRVAQVVKTVTAINGVSAVVFEIDGVPADVPTDHGVVDRPVTPADYLSVAPRS